MLLSLGSREDLRVGFGGGLLYSAESVATIIMAGTPARIGWYHQATQRVNLVVSADVRGI